MSSGWRYECLQDSTAPAPWPIVLALGIILFIAGMFTSAAVCILGGVVCLAALVGRLRNSLQRRRIDSASFPARPESASTNRAKVDQAGWINSDAHQAPISHRTYPFSAGAMGGLAGGVFIATLARCSTRESAGDLVPNRSFGFRIFLCS
jgi:hypothetical protein